MAQNLEYLAVPALLSCLGCNQLSGATVVAGTPDLPAPNSELLLFAGFDIPKTIAVGAADASGVWEFAGLASNARGYGVLAKQARGGAYDPVMKASQIPSPMPPDPSEHP
jgi:hypothetical protein